MRDAEEVLRSMGPPADWFTRVPRTSTTVKDRTEEQKVWDSAVFACGEFLRRVMHKVPLGEKLNGLLLENLLTKRDEEAP